MVGASARPQSNRRWRGHAIPFTVLFAGYRRGLTRASMMRLFDCKKISHTKWVPFRNLKKNNLLFFFLKTSTLTLCPFHWEQTLRSVRYSLSFIMFTSTVLFLKRNVMCKLSDTKSQFLAIVRAVYLWIFAFSAQNDSFATMQSVRRVPWTDFDSREENVQFGARLEFAKCTYDRVTNRRNIWYRFLTAT